MALALTPTSRSPTDPFVKVYLLQDGRKMSKKKTAVKRADPNPVFNEAMIFSVPAVVLQVGGGPGRGAAPATPASRLGAPAGGSGLPQALPFLVERHL